MVTLLTTQFAYIEFLGGYLRPYHFLIAALLVVALDHLPRLLASKIIRRIVLFNGAILVGVLLSSQPTMALLSYALVLLNSGIVVALALTLSSRSNLESFVLSTLFVTTLLICVFSGLQMFMFHSTGTNIGLSETQVQQIKAGFAPALFNEANTFAKFLLTPFFLFLPFLVRQGFTRKLGLIFAAIVFCFLINFMRSAMFAAAIGLFVFALWLLYQRRQMIFARLSLIVLPGGMTIALFLLVFDAHVAEYNLYKFHSLLEPSSWQNDGSWQFRQAAMSLAVEQTLASPVRVLFGNGWGQVFAFLHGEARQVGGADIVNIFAYSGVLGVTAFVLLIASALSTANKRVKLSNDPQGRCFFEGLFLALVANLAVGLISGVLLLPSFWLLFGLLAAAELRQPIYFTREAYA